MSDRSAEGENLGGASRVTARAPGKLVVSGAYSVLWGAPCLVTAVDRFAVAVRGELPIHISEEVKAAIALGLLDRACLVDASQLRAPVADAAGTTRKLGLGSSAAIIVATLAAARAEWPTTESRLSDSQRNRIFADALLAHRTAQKGGSGVDVAASVFGGLLACRIGADGALAVEPRAFPPSVEVHVFASAQPASTQDMVARVRAFERLSPARHATLIGQAGACAERAAQAASCADFLDALHAQDGALRVLAREADVPIFTQEFDVLHAAAATEGAFFGPSGAGGGDIGIYVSERAPGEAFLAALARLEVDRLDVRVGAHGVRVETVPAS